MAATAYAAAVSLLNTMDQIKIHPLLSTYFNINYSIESLREKVDFFVDFVEKFADAESEEAEDLLRRIADVAHEAGEIINVEAADRVRIKDCIKENAIKAEEEKCSYAEDLVRRMAAVALKAMPRKLQRKITEEKTAESSSVSSSSSATAAVLLGLQRVTEEMNFIKEKVSKLEEGTGFIIQSSMHVPSSSSAPPPNAKTTTMVGFDGYVEQLLDQLTGYHSGRQILPIVGMGGIGKTTLATNVYHNSLMLHHFDIRVWITVSQEFSARNIILQALSCLGESISNTDTSESDDQLGEKLFKILYGRRYLIVLDDIWSMEAWEKIMFFFPENNNGSRIVITTRQSVLVDYFGSSALAVDFLDEKNSWELFCEKTFAQRGCPHPELEKIGKRIVKDCKGLPLTITVIGGLLRKSAKTQEYWEKIAQDKSLILDSEEGNVKPLSILYLSYKHLPVWLKPCFLYLGVYPEDHEIKVSQLIKLCVAEGFIRPKREQSLEEIAESYINELVDRNLLLVVGLRRDKKLESCRVHDVVRELCIKIGEKEKYFCVQRDIDGTRYFIVDEPTAMLFTPREYEETPISLFHPLIILEGQIAAPFKSRLLSVLVSDITPLYYSSQQVNLRFLFGSINFAVWLELGLDSSIQLLWSMQTLIINSSFNAPCEIWKMPQLRHIEMIRISLPDPPSPTCDEDAVIVLHNLQTLKRVQNFKLSEEVCKRIPNVKELGIEYEWEAGSYYQLHNLGCFNKLETLEIELLYSNNRWKYLSDLPSSLKELTLWNCNLVWNDMAMIASLPHLQFLKLAYDAVVGPKWNLVDEQFLSLKGLVIVSCDLVYWNNEDNSNFPMLETLHLDSLCNLEEIPSSIGDIPTLERMHLKNCSESANMSAINILEEQESVGNESLQLTLDFDYKDEAVMWRGRIQQLGITCQNVHIKGRY